MYRLSITLASQSRVVRSGILNPCLNAEHIDRLEMRTSLSTGTHFNQAVSSWSPFGLGCCPELDIFFFSPCFDMRSHRGLVRTLHHITKCHGRRGSEACQSVPDHTTQRSSVRLLMRNRSWSCCDEPLGGEVVGV